MYYSLAEGTDLETFEESGIVTALDLFSDSESVDIDLLFSVNEETFSSAVGSIESKLVEIADSRKDLVALISPPESITTPKQGISLNSNTITTTLVEWGGLFSSSYVVLDSTSVYVYDKYNDKYRWIPASGHVAGLCANTDEVADPWYSPAGLNRGVIRGVLKVAYNPNKTRRDELYKIGINPIVSFTGQGIVLFGDKTALSRPSAFDRINVRRLFLVLEKAISTASRFQLFEFNDEFTRAQFRSLVEPFLREVQGRRGITDFLVVCDESNNTGEIIDRNEFVADIYIKPARSINFITLNFIATRTGADFTEIIGLTSN
jgi:phage tail sheath protein FI